MQQVIVNHNNTTYCVAIKKQRNFKRLTLRINSKLQPQLSMPYGVSYKQAYNFVLSNINWLNQQLSKVTQNNTILHNAIKKQSIVCCNQTYSIHISQSNTTKNSLCIINNSIIIKYTNANNIITLLTKALKDISYPYFVMLANKYCQLLNVKFNKLMLTDTKSKWGSCSNKGNIRVNFRISLCPNFVIEYLIAHEITHLLHFNHSKEFWQTLHTIYNNCTLAQDWLKNNGKLLF